MSRLNREWHLKNRMPRNPSFEERMKWHMEHAKHCACRPVPANLAAEMRRRRDRPD